MSTTTSKNIWNFDPRSVPGCVLWLDAEDKSTLTGTSPVTAWRDKSVLSNNTTSYGGSPSVTSSIYGRKAMYFNGSTYLTGSISAASSTTITVFLVGSLIAPFGGFSGLLCFGNPSEYDYDNDGSLPITMYIDQYKIYGARNSSSQPTPISANVPFIYVLQYDGSYINSWKNGTIQTDPSSNISNSGTFTYTHYAVGSRAGAILGQYTWSGYIGEVIVYQSPVTDTNRQEIEGYLAWKWGFIENVNFLYTHPFISIKPYLRTFQPRDIPTCTLWLDAGDGNSISLSGSNVTQWNDKSGNERNLTQTTSGLRPTYSSVSKAIVFNGTRYLDIPDALNAIIPTYTIFLAEKRASADARFLIGQRLAVANVGLVLGYNGSTIAHHTTVYVADLMTTINAYSVNDPIRVTRYQYTGTTRSTFVNGGEYSNSQSFSNTLTVWSNANIGAGYNTNSGNWYIGNVYEVLFYNSVLTTSQCQQIEGYLAWKWNNISSLPSTHPFKKFRPSTALPFLPKQITGLSLWLDANDPAGTGVQPSAGALGTWIDKSGLNNHMTGVGTTPTFSNYPPGAVYFAGTGHFSNSNAVLSNIYTLFFVYKQASLIQDAILYTTSINYSNFFEGFGFIPNIEDVYYLQLGNDESSLYSGSPSPFPYNTMNLAVLSFSGNEIGCNVSLYYNGSNVLSTTQTAAITYSNLNIGGIPALGGSFNGYMYEVIAYNGTLTTREQQSVEGYLAQKWKL